MQFTYPVHMSADKYSYRTQLTVVNCERKYLMNWVLLTNTQHNDIQHNDIQHNDIQHNDTQHDWLISDTQHK